MKIHRDGQSTSKIAGKVANVELIAPNCFQTDRIIAAEKTIQAGSYSR